MKNFIWWTFRFFFRDKDFCKVANNSRIGKSYPFLAVKFMQYLLHILSNFLVENFGVNLCVWQYFVIDETQDMDEDEFGLIRALMEYNEEMRVIAVGDDDQNIYEVCSV